MWRKLRFNGCLLGVSVVWALTSYAPAVVIPASESRNTQEAVEAFLDMGLGLFIHWSVDVQYGSVISHSLVGADDAYRQRYFSELPRTFNPTRYDPTAWAELAKLCGFKYSVFTVKHHNGFCMWPTETTPFSIKATPYGQDIIGPYANAFRNAGLKVGFYFSPEDFWFLDQQGYIPARHPDHGYTQTSQNPELARHDERQMKELLSRYDPVDIWFFDSFEPPAELKKLVWDTDPNAIITRGAMATPEQTLSNAELQGPWEACFTLGKQWQYRGTNEKYKSAREVIELLIQTRARGGNLLLNVGPNAHGEIPPEQEAILRELGLWLFVNGEAIYGVRPWYQPSDGKSWFTRAKDGSAVYIFLVGEGEWPLGERRECLVKGVRLSADSQVTVLGHGGQVLEHQPEVSTQVIAEPRPDGIALSVMRAHRLYNEKRWPNPVVVKVTHPRAIDE